MCPKTPIRAPEGHPARNGSAGLLPRRSLGAESRLDWLLDDLITRVAHVEKAVILSRDGLPAGTSATLSREDSDHLSALAAGIQSLANGGALHFKAGQVHQTLIEMDRGYLFVTAAGEGSCLAVLADSRADLGLVAYDMALVAKQLGQMAYDDYAGSS